MYVIINFIKFKNQSCKSLAINYETMLIILIWQTTIDLEKNATVHVCAVAIASMSYNTLPFGWQPKMLKTVISFPLLCLE